MDNDEPNGLCYWMIDYEQELRVRERIACPEKGYPASEAKYATTEEWSKDNGGKDWGDYVAETA